MRGQDYKLTPVERDIIRMALHAPSYPKTDLRRYVPEVMLVCLKLGLREPPWFEDPACKARVEMNRENIPLWREMGLLPPDGATPAKPADQAAFDEGVAAATARIIVWLRGLAERAAEGRGPQFGAFGDETADAIEAGEHLSY